MSSEERRCVRNPAGVTPPRSRMPIRSTQRARGIHIPSRIHRVHCRPISPLASERLFSFLSCRYPGQKKRLDQSANDTTPRSYATNATMPAATPEPDAPTIHSWTYIFIRSNPSPMSDHTELSHIAPEQAPEIVKTIGIDTAGAQWESRREPLRQSACATIRDRVRRPLHRSRL